MDITRKEIAQLIDHSILHPTATDDDLKRECEIAHKYKVASVCVKPYAVKQASVFLHDSPVAVGCVVGFPSGNSAIQVKKYETQLAIQDGAVEIDMVVNVGKVLSGDWDYVTKEISEITKESHVGNACVKVIFETDYVSRDEDIITLCEICTSAGVDFVKTSSGFGFVKMPSGDFNYAGAQLEHIALMKKHVGNNVRIKAAGGIRSFDELVKFYEAGASRIGATATHAIMEEACKRLNE
ncbi:MAG: deoxyribose-phosphate aldolase [Bacteroidales bacterium]|nr:deoxyribose-phosphate aldolase [Bacteroidales bacterium]